MNLLHHNEPCKKDGGIVKIANIIIRQAGGTLAVRWYLKDQWVVCHEKCSVKSIIIHELYIKSYCKNANGSMFISTVVLLLVHYIRWRLKIGIKLEEVLSYGYFLMKELIAEDKFNSKDVNARNTMLSLASIFGTRTITSTLDLLDNSISNYKVRRWKQNTFEGTHISENDTIVTEFVTDSSQRILYQVSSHWSANSRVVCQ